MYTSREGTCYFDIFRLNGSEENVQKEKENKNEEDEEEEMTECDSDSSSNDEYSFQDKFHNKRKNDNQSSAYVNLQNQNQDAVEGIKVKKRVEFDVQSDELHKQYENLFLYQNEQSASLLKIRAASCRMRTDFSVHSEHHLLATPLVINFAYNAYEGRMLAVGMVDGTVRVFRTTDGSSGEEGIRDPHTHPLFEKKAHSISVTDLKFSPPSLPDLCGGDDSLFSTSCDSTVSKHNLNENKTEWKIKAHPEWVKQLAINPAHTNMFATCGSEGTIKIWDDRAICNAMLSFQPMEESSEDVMLECGEEVHPQIEWKNLHKKCCKNSNRKAIIDSKASSISGLNFIRRNPPVLASSGISDGRVKVWDLRKISKKIKPMAEIIPSMGRGILWMDNDLYNENLVVCTAEGLVTVYKIATIVEKEWGGEMENDDAKCIVLQADVHSNQRQLDYICRPGLSSDGRFVSVMRNNSSRVLVFDLWSQQPNIAVYEMQLPREGDEDVKAICMAWGKRENANQWALGLQNGVVQILQSDSIANNKNIKVNYKNTEKEKQGRNEEEEEEKENIVNMSCNTYYECRDEYGNDIHNNKYTKHFANSNTYGCIHRHTNKQGDGTNKYHNIECITTTHSCAHSNTCSDDEKEKKKEKEKEKEKTDREKRQGEELCDNKLNKKTKIIDVPEGSMAANENNKNDIIIEENTKKKEDKVNYKNCNNKMYVHKILYDHQAEICGVKNVGVRDITNVRGKDNGESNEKHTTMNSNLNKHIDYNIKVNESYPIEQAEYAVSAHDTMSHHQSSSSSSSSLSNIHKTPVHTHTHNIINTRTHSSSPSSSSLSSSFSSTIMKKNKEKYSKNVHTVRPLNLYPSPKHENKLKNLNSGKFIFDSQTDLSQPTPFEQTDSSYLHNKHKMQSKTSGEIDTEKHAQQQPERKNDNICTEKEEKIGYNNNNSANLYEKNNNKENISRISFNENNIFATPDKYTYEFISKLFDDDDEEEEDDECTEERNIHMNNRKGEEGEEECLMSNLFVTNTTGMRRRDSYLNNFLHRFKRKSNLSDICLNNGEENNTGTREEKEDRKAHTGGNELYNNGILNSLNVCKNANNTFNASTPTKCIAAECSVSPHKNEKTNCIQNSFSSSSSSSDTSLNIKNVTNKITEICNNCKCHNNSCSTLCTVNELCEERGTHSPSRRKNEKEREERKTIGTEEDSSNSNYYLNRSSRMWLYNSQNNNNSNIINAHNYNNICCSQESTSSVCSFIPPVPVARANYPSNMHSSSTPSIHKHFSMLQSQSTLPVCTPHSPTQNTQSNLTFEENVSQYSSFSPTQKNNIYNHDYMNNNMYNNKMKMYEHSNNNLCMASQESVESFIAPHPTRKTNFCEKSSFLSSTQPILPPPHFSAHSLQAHTYENCGGREKGGGGGGGEEEKKEERNSNI